MSTPAQADPWPQPSRVEAPVVHPGQVLVERFLVPRGLSRRGLARALRVPARRIHEIARTRRSISADTALRLARYFGTTGHFWLTLQVDYDLDRARRARGAEIEREVGPAPPRPATPPYPSTLDFAG